MRLTDWVRKTFLKENGPEKYKTQEIKIISVNFPSQTDFLTNQILENIYSLPCLKVISCKFPVIDL